MLRITLREIEVFASIAAEQGNVTRAANSVGMTQSAASQALDKLEAVLGVQLFDRIGRRLVMNEHGRKLLPRARALLDSAGEMQEMFTTGGYHLRLGASMTIASYILPPHLAEFRAASPHAQVEMRVGNTHEIVAAVADLSVDFGLIEGPCHHPALVVEPWCEDELIVFTAAGHPLANRTVDRQELALADWVLRELGSGTREEVERLLLPLVPGLNVVMELGHPEAIKNAVAAGLGVSCLSRHVIGREIDAGLLVQVQAGLPGLGRMLYQVRHREKAITRGMEAFFGLGAKRNANVVAVESGVPSPLS